MLESGGSSSVYTTKMILVNTLKWPEVFETKFVVTSQDQGGLYIWLQLEVHHVTNIEYLVRTFFVGMLLHALLSTKKML